MDDAEWKGKVSEQLDNIEEKQEEIKELFEGCRHNCRDTTYAFGQRITAMETCAKAIKGSLSRFWGIIVAIGVLVVGTAVKIIFFGDK